jgi:hypothetical protein
VPPNARDEKHVPKLANDPSDAAEAIDAIERNDPIDPMQNELPIEPIENELPIEPMEQNDPIDPMDRALPSEPTERQELESGAPERLSDRSTLSDRTSLDVSAMATERRFEIKIATVAPSRANCMTTPRVGVRKRHFITVSL